MRIQTLSFPTFASTALRLCALPAALSLCLLPAPAASDDYAQWPKTATVYLKTTPDGANVAATVRNFPVLVRLTAANFAFAEAKANGQDLRFAGPDGKHLKYQIDRWDAAKGLAEAWVRLDSVKGNASDQSFTMLWGNAAAADSSNGKAVFDSANGYLGVWHLGGTGTAARKNSVAGGVDAEPVYFDGGETTAGMIGLADSLDGDPPSPDNLQIGDGYEALADGFTFSIWCNPTSASASARLLDIGNGPGLDEIVLQRSGTAEGIVFENYQGNVPGKSVKVDNCFPIKQWQQFTVTVAGGKVDIYRNGALILSDNAVGFNITRVRRAFNYFGRNDWNTGSYFKGLLDEPVLSKVPRSADWIRLAYANQNAAQTLIAFSKPVPPIQCTATFTAPSDTSISEGSTLVLNGSAECATGYNWSVIAGPGPRILDPEFKALQVFLPRIARDTSITYRFSAEFPDSSHWQDVKVTIKADIPDPTFTLPASMDWNGMDSLQIKPVITNLAAIQASRQPDLNYAWSAEAMDADTGWREGALMLKKANAEGTFLVNLCLDNNGPVVCKSMNVVVKLPTGLASGAAPAAGIPSGTQTGFDAGGRRILRARGTAAPTPFFFPPAVSPPAVSRPIAP
jgi:hypothetical protein